MDLFSFPFCSFTSTYADWHNGHCFKENFVGRGFSRDNQERRNGALAPAVHMNTRQEKATILVVEDEAKMRRLLELQLGEEGFVVCTAPDAETGLQLLVREKPDLVVTDLRLPGMSGLEFLQAVKRVNAALPVVVMTAYGTVESAVEAMKGGASDYVTKPIFARRARAGDSQGTGFAPPARRESFAARGARPPLRLQQHHRAERQDAGGAGAGRARSARRIPPCCSAAKAASARI